MALCSVYRSFFELRSCVTLIVRNKGEKCSPGDVENLVYNHLRKSFPTLPGNIIDMAYCEGKSNLPLILSKAQDNKTHSSLKISKAGPL